VDLSFIELDLASHVKVGPAMFAGQCSSLLLEEINPMDCGWPPLPLLRPESCLYD